MVIDNMWTQFGDTPFCLDQGEKTFYEETATVQGYGLTEDGENGALLETNVTIINNQQCLEQFKSNITDTINKVGTQQNSSQKYIRTSTEAESQ